MCKLTASVAICAVMAAAPVAAQQETGATDPNVLRSDLPETHAGFDLPEIDAGSAEMTEDERRSLAAQSTAAQQMGNVIASKYASGAARDLGDAMVLLHAGILRRIAAEAPDVQVPAEAQDAIADLDALNGPEADAALADWMTDAYPRMIEAWRQAGEQGLGELSRAVLPHLERQHAVAEEIAAAEGELGGLDSAAVEALRLGGANAGTSEGDGPAGAEGQIGERQHTPEPEVPAVQTGENYAHEQVEADAQTETRDLPEGGTETTAAGERDTANAGGLFAAMTNPSVEIEQLDRQDVAADQVEIVAVQELLTEAEMESFRATLENADLSALRDAATGHAAISEALGQAGASMDDVVAIDVLDEGVVAYTFAD